MIADASKLYSRRHGCHALNPANIRATSSPHSFSQPIWHIHTISVTSPYIYTTPSLAEASTYRRPVPIEDLIFLFALRPTLYCRVSEGYRPNLQGNSYVGIFQFCLPACQMACLMLFMRDASPGFLSFWLSRSRRFLLDIFAEFVRLGTDEFRHLE